MTHQLERRKREEPVGELGNVARHKRGLTNWRGGRGRSRLVSLETWHVTNRASMPRGEEQRAAGLLGWKPRTSQTSTHILDVSTSQQPVSEHGHRVSQQS